MIQVQKSPLQDWWSHSAFRQSLGNSLARSKKKICSRLTVREDSASVGLIKGTSRFKEEEWVRE